MRALDRKLLRDLLHVWGQALAIAAVLAAGVATLILAQGAYSSLSETRAAYYERHRFADVFAHARRAPRYLEDRIAAIPGVMAAETRIESAALLDLPGVAQPATGRILSLPASGRQKLNALYLRAGRLPEPFRDEEVVVNEAFAKANGFAPGARFTAILNGRKKSLLVVGIALSPEFIYALGPGDLVPDDKRFGVIWMNEAAAEAAFDLKGAFNSAALSLRRDARPEAVLEALDAILADYGGRGGYLRKDQQSHAFLDAELTQLRAMSRIIPPIFLAVAAFLVNMTLARLIALEREQIGLFKALGYSNWAIGAHYFKFVTAIAVVGVAMGTGLGVWLGRGLTRLYGDFYHFPFLVFVHPAEIFVAAAGIGCAAAWLGGYQAIVRALRLSPAVAMAPPTPLLYRRGLAARLGLTEGASLLSLMMVRHLIRFPVRAGLTILGVAAAGALLVLSLSTNDSVEKMIQITYFQSSRQDVTVIFDNLKPERIVQDVARLPGVLKAEANRDIDVTLRSGALEKRVTLQALRPSADLQKLLDLDLKPFPAPEFGLSLSEKLTSILKVRPGDRIQVETMDQRRRVFELPVTAIEQGYLGLTAHADYDYMTALLGDGRAVTSIDLSVDAAREEELYRELKASPSVSAVMLLRASLTTFRQTLVENIVIMMTVYVALATVIVFGVVYNSARIQLSERARELASLRVLGFTRAEVSMVLLGEIAITVALAVPISFGLGYLFTYLLLLNFETELYRVPLVISRETYGWSALIVIATAAVTALLVRRRIDRLDLIAVLKTRE